MDDSKVYVTSAQSPTCSDSRRCTRGLRLRSVQRFRGRRRRLVGHSILPHVLLVSSFVIVFISQVAFALPVVEYWDNPSPSGAWHTTFWSPSPTGGSLEGWNDGNSAVFSATDAGATGNFTVTLDSSVVVRDLTYTGGNLGSALQIAAVPGANTITIGFSPMNVTVDSLTTLIVAPDIVGAGGSLILQGDFLGTLVLTGTNTYNGGTTILTGVLQLGSVGATGSIVGAVTNNDTFNIVNGNTAGITTITNNSFGTTSFFNASTAGNTPITNNGGFTAFFNTSTAGTAAITNNGGTTEFFDSSRAGHAVITTNDGGFTEFFATSTADNATLNVNSGGETEFNNASNAVNATITNAGGVTNFNDTSAAGSATIANSANGTTNFNNASTAGNATITNNFDGLANFNNTSTAGNSTITNNLGGATIFFNSSTAGNATVTNNGGLTLFGGTSTAANSSITTNDGGKTFFLQLSTGGQARLVTNAGGIVDISELTSAGMPAGSIQGAGTYFLGSKALTVGLNNLSTTVSGAILDGGTPVPTIGVSILLRGPLPSANPLNIGGSLIKVGAGTLTLTGANTYSGGTSFNGGILAANSDANLGTGPLSFNGGELQALATGGGIISSKTITLNAEGGTFLADGGTTSIFSALISGPGSLTKDGLGALVLTGPNTYSGGTSFNGGFVAVNSDANLGTGPLSFNGGGLQALAAGGGLTTNKAITLDAGGGTFSADAGTISTFSAAISGPGSLTKNGFGALVLSGANTYQGGTVLNAGTLTVNGAQALGLGNVTVNGGVLRADPQPINVKGNYTQGAVGTLQLQVAGANPGQYDTLNVGGNASLGGTLQLISLGFQPKGGDQLTLVTTGGVVSGRFGQFVDPFATGGPGFAISALIYEANSVLLEFRTAASFALTPNQRAAASLIDAVHLEPGAAKLIAFLNTDPFANLPGDFEKISPDGLTAFYEISFSNANIQRLNLEDRLDNLRAGSNGFSSNMKVNGASANLEDRMDADGKSSKAVVEPVLQRAPENRWGVWVTGFGDFVSVDADANGKGYDFTTGGASLGIDYRITDQLAIGAMGEYSHTWTDLNPGGHIDVDSGRGGIYATWFNRGLYLNGAIYGGHNNYDSGRPALGGVATGGTEGEEWSTFISGGYDFHLGALVVGPIGALQYTDVHVDGFSENGSLAPLALHSDSVESLRSDVGFRAFYQWQIGNIQIEPSLKAAWEHEYKYSALPVTAGFAEFSSPSATFFGPSEGHDSAVISAGISSQLTPALTVYVNYDGQLGRGNYSSNAVTGGVRFGF
jgi:outer membrane autotransporter protein